MPFYCVCRQPSAAHHSGAFLVATSVPHGPNHVQLQRRRRVQIPLGPTITPASSPPDQDFLFSGEPAGSTCARSQLESQAEQDTSSDVGTGKPFNTDTNPDPKPVREQRVHQQRRTWC
jgi:hypothetical protein